MNTSHAKQRSAWARDVFPQEMPAWRYGVPWPRFSFRIVLYFRPLLGVSLYDICVMCFISPRISPVQVKVGEDYAKELDALSHPMAAIEVRDAE